MSERTVRDSLHDLKAAGAIERVVLPSRVVGYRLNRHPDAETDPRFGPFQRPAEPSTTTSYTTDRSGSRDRKRAGPRFPEGVKPSDVAEVLTTELGLPSPKYDGPEVRSAGETMVAHAWSLDQLAAACRAYRGDERKDNPPARGLFFARHREATVERYGPTRAPAVQPAPLDLPNVELPPELQALYGEAPS